MRRLVHNLNLTAIAILCISILLPNTSMAGTGYDQWTEAVIIAQPQDVVECEGSLDQFLFVVAAPLNRDFKIAYKWYKDGKAVTNWVEDFGQITFDTLKYSMSGVYHARLFAFDPDWTSDYGNPFSYDSARVSNIETSQSVNLYALQDPEFMKDIPNAVTKVGNDLVFTFDANIYGEHNMENPTYWTEIDWFKGTTELEDNERFAGTDGSIMTIQNVTAADLGTDYRVRLMSDCDTIWSNDFAISEEPQAIITLQPLDVEGCVNEVVQLNVEADATIMNTSLSYQWMVNGTPIMDEAGKFNGSNSASMNVTLNPALGYDGTEAFTCSVWPVGYPNNGIMSNAAKITWKTAPAITVDLNSDYSAKEDEDIELFVTVTGENLTYTWTHDGNDLGIDNDTLSLSVLTMSEAGDYVVTVSNDCGEVTSATATLVVTQGPIVTSVDAVTGLGLSQNFPNPFDVSSTITFNTVVSGNASLVLTDMLGNTVAPLFNGFVNEGNLNTIQLNASELNLNTGTYFITLRMGDRVETRQISVVR